MIDTMDMASEQDVKDMEDRGFKLEHIYGGIYEFSAENGSYVFYTEGGGTEAESPGWWYVEEVNSGPYYHGPYDSITELIKDCKLVPQNHSKGQSND